MLKIKYTFKLIKIFYWFDDFFKFSIKFVNKIIFNVLHFILFIINYLNMYVFLLSQASITGHKP